MRPLILLATALAFAACGDSPTQSKLGAPSGERTRELRMLVLDVALQDMPGMRRFVSEVARRSGGRLKITLHGIEVEREPDMAELVRQGRYDITWTKARRFPEIPAMAATTLPMLLDGYTLQTALFERGFDRQLLKALDPVGLHGLGLLPDYLARPLSRKGSLARATDWARIDGFAGPMSPLREKALKAMGVRRTVDEPLYGPTPAFNEERADGGEQLVPGLVGNYLGAFGIHVTMNVATSSRVLVLLANPKTMDDLSAQERRWLQAAAADGGRVALREGRRVEMQALEHACRTTAIRAVVAPERDVSTLRARVMKVYRAVDDALFQQALDAIEETRRDVPPDPVEIPASCRGPLPARALPVRTSTAPGALDGEYRYRTTVAQYRALDLDEPFAQDYAGTYSVRLRAGAGLLRRRNSSQTTGVPAKPQEFEYRVDGDRVTFYTEDQPITVQWRRQDDGSLRFSSKVTLDPTVAPAYAAIWRRVR